MKTYISIHSLFLLLLLAGCESSSEKSASETGNRPDYALAIHGGAGAIEKNKMTPEMDSLYRVTLSQALDAGELILKSGGTALDAVESAIIILEDSPLFNAGKGAVFTYEGTNELDASIMDGATLSAGAIAGVKRIKNPVRVARAVMEKSEHVFLYGSGAEAFALHVGMDTVSPDYFFTDRRWQNLERAKKLEQDKSLSSSTLEHQNFNIGTVGAVALDSHGNLAAATSTGGMTNKRWQRIGDAPVVGAGTYADNRSCAVSCTGHGEYFIRHAVAYDLACRIRYAHQSIQEAGDTIIYNVLLPEGGRGGLIGVDNQGNIIMPFNTEGMYRGYCKPGQRQVAIYEGE